MEKGRNIDLRPHRMTIIDMQGVSAPKIFAHLEATSLFWFKVNYVHE